VHDDAEMCYFTLLFYFLWCHKTNKAYNILGCFILFCFILFCFILFYRTMYVCAAGLAWGYHHLYRTAWGNYVYFCKLCSDCNRSQQAGIL